MGMRTNLDLYKTIIMARKTPDTTGPAEFERIVNRFTFAATEDESEVPPQSSRKIPVKWDNPVKDLIEKGHEDFDGLGDK